MTNSPAIRLFRWEDLSALTQLVSLASNDDSNRTASVSEYLRYRFQKPGFDPQRDCWLAAIDDEIVGYCDAHFEPENGEVTGEGYVHRLHQRQGIGTQLLAAAETCAVER